MIGRAVKTKAHLYAEAAALTDNVWKRSAEVGKSFQVGVQARTKRTTIVWFRFDDPETCDLDYCVKNTREELTLAP